MLCIVVIIKLISQAFVRVALDNYLFYYFYPIPTALDISNNIALTGLDENRNTVNGPQPPKDP